MIVEVRVTTNDEASWRRFERAFRVVGPIGARVFDGRVVEQVRGVVLILRHARGGDECLRAAFG